MSFDPYKIYRPTDFAVHLFWPLEYTLFKFLQCFTDSESFNIDKLVIYSEHWSILLRVNISCLISYQKIFTASVTHPKKTWYDLYWTSVLYSPTFGYHVLWLIKKRCLVFRKTWYTDKQRISKMFLLQSYRYHFHQWRLSNYRSQLDRCFEIKSTHLSRVGMNCLNRKAASQIISRIIKIKPYCLRDVAKKYCEFWWKTCIYHLTANIFMHRYGSYSAHIFIGRFLLIQTTHS